MTRIIKRIIIRIQTQKGIGSYMKESYVYPAVIGREGKDFVISFPDFPDQVTYADTYEEIISAGQEVLALCISDNEATGTESPIPSAPENITIKDGERLVYIHVWMPYFRNIEKVVYVKKTLTIPKWLDEMAKQQNINFSATLVKGLKNRLGIRER